MTGSNGESGPSRQAGSGDGTFSLTCIAIRDETHDVRSFFLRVEDGAAISHLPGQFLTFTFEIEGRTVHRCYTISSSPASHEPISITVKRTPGGVVSPWMHQRLGVGDNLRASGPGGSFSYLEHPAPKYLFISGGSGITPLMSMVRHLDDLRRDADVVFIHAARSARDLIFHRNLKGIAGRQPRMRNVFVCENAVGAPAGAFAGRVSADLLAEVAPDACEREVFCCGPAPFMTQVREDLRRAGHDPARYHEESFSFDEIARDDPGPRSGATYTVQFSASGKTVTCAAGETVLDAARAAGIRIPTGCTLGVCGTCKSELLAGSVDMRHEGGLRQREIDQGMILACCSWPLSDLVVKR